jgi:hypothetical protein
MFVRDATGAASIGKRGPQNRDCVTLEIPRLTH